MLQITIYGGVTGLSLFFGALTGIVSKWRQKNIARFMAFGAGVLICALTFGLMENAFGHGGFDAVIIGFLAGGLTFIGFDYLIHYFGGRAHRKHPQYKKVKDVNGALITAGTVLDGIPESVALGVALATGQAGGLLMLAAITLSNFPEGISSITGLKREGFKNWQILTIWGIVAVVSLLFAVGGFVFLKDIDPNITGTAEAFAAGAILAMLANSMMPEAYEDGGASIGILTVLGFLTAFLISRFK